MEKYTYCEKLIWYAMNKTMTEFLSKRHPNWNTKLLKINSQKRYKQIITELPDIGSVTKNSLRICLSGAALWLAIYESCEEKIIAEEFGEMVKATMSSPLIFKTFSLKKPFTKKSQTKKKKLLQEIIEQVIVNLIGKQNLSKEEMKMSILLFIKNVEFAH